MCVYSVWMLDYVKKSHMFVFNEQENAAVTTIKIFLPQNHVRIIAYLYKNKGWGLGCGIDVSLLRNRSLQRGHAALYPERRVEVL